MSEKRFSLVQVGVAYVLMLAGGLAAASIILRAGARAIERSVEELS